MTALETNVRNSDYWTPEEIAEDLRITRQTVLERIRRGELPAVRVGNRFRIHAREVMEWKRHLSCQDR